MNEELTEQSEDLEQVDTIEETTEEPVIADSEEGSEEEKASRSQNAKQRLKRKLRESEEQRALIAEEARKQQERIDALERKVESVINPPPPRPSRVNFDTEEDYEDALFSWRDRSKSQPVKEPVKQQAPLAVTYEAKENWHNQMDVASDKYDDFETKLASIPPSSMSDPMTYAIMESDYGGEIAYFLGNNHAEAARIAKLSLAKQVIEIDRLGNKFKSKTTRAPEPIDPLTSADAGKNKKVHPLLKGATFT